MGYQLARFIIHTIVRLSCRIDVKGLELLPRSGSYIAVANHLGRLDAAMVYYFLDRPDVILLVAEKYRDNPLTAWFARQLNGVYIDRFNADFVAVREVLKRLKAGGVLVMAPEGTRSLTEALQPGNPGAAYLAAKAGTQIYPVGVTGTEDRKVWANLKRLRRSQVTGRVGQPFTLPPLKGSDRDAALKQYTDEIMCRIAALLPPGYRGVYAEHPRLQELLETAPAA